MGGADDGHNESQDDSQDRREKCDEQRCFQAVQQPQIAVFFNKIQIQICVISANIIWFLPAFLNKRAVGTSQQLSMDIPDVFALPE